MEKLETEEEDDQDQYQKQDQRRTQILEILAGLWVLHSTSRSFWHLSCILCVHKTFSANAKRTFFNATAVAVAVAVATTAASFQFSVLSFSRPFSAAILPVRRFVAVVAILPGIGIGIGGVHNWCT